VRDGIPFTFFGVVVFKNTGMKDRCVQVYILFLYLYIKIYILTQLSFIPVYLKNYYTEQCKWDPIAHFDEYVA